MDKSITTASTPHDGTTLTPIIMNIFPFAQSIAAWVGSFDSNILKSFYSFDLDQWGLKKQEEESYDEFWSRIKSSKIKNSKNFSSWDLSIEGAKQFNSIYSTNQLTYYFSFATYATRQQEYAERHLPDKNMRWLLWPAGLLIGQTKKENHFWYKNDGIVNTISMYAPTTGKNGPEPATIFNGIPEKGVWQNIETYHMDHHKIIGANVNKEEANEIFSIYLNHCKLLYGLKMITPKCKLILFDLDGVVIDTEPLYAKGEIKLFKEYGVIIPEEDWKLFRGCTEEKFYDLSMKKV